MPIAPRGTSFIVSHGSGKDRKRVTVKTQAEAGALQAKWEADERAATVAMAVAATKGDPTKTLQDAYDRAYREKWSGSKGERTSVLNAKQMMALLGPNTLVTEIDCDAIDKALDALEDGTDDADGNSGPTINKKLSALNVMLEAARSRGWLKAVPKVKRRPEGKRRTYWYTEVEEREMVAACHRLGMPELADWIAFGIDTGFRRSEMLNLKVADCTDNHLHLHAGATKNDDARVIPATPLVWDIVEKARKAGHKRVFESTTNATLRTAWDNLRVYLKKTDDPKYIVHVLRHTCATRLAKGGASAPQIKQWMGHKAIQTTMIYIHLTGGDLGSVAGLLARTPSPRPDLKAVNG